MLGHCDLCQDNIDQAFGITMRLRGLDVAAFTSRGVPFQKVSMPITVGLDPGAPCNDTTGYKWQFAETCVYILK